MADKAAAQGSPHHKPSGGGFQNPWPSYSKKDVKAQLGGIPFLTGMKKEPGKADLAALLLLAGKPDFNAAEGHFRETRSSVVVTWLGHCSFLIQVYGATFLTDPVWCKHGSTPANYGLGSGFVAKRVVPPPCAMSDLPELDAILLTSSRPDHLDKATVRELASTTRARWFVPLNLGEVLTANGVDGSRITELDWYQSSSVGRDVKVVCTPSQFIGAAERVGRAGPLQGASPSLWCSWTVVGIRSRFFFAGGTGYRAVPRDNPFPPYSERQELPRCPAFEEIAARYGPFSVAFLPVGGYTPRHIMSSIQLDPLDAACVHKDLKARQSIAMNWGTFVQGEEELLEPLRRLERSLSEVGLSDSDFVVMMHGKTRVFH